jgi:hypothetical protein
MIVESFFGFNILQLTGPSINLVESILQGVFEQN